MLRLRDPGLAACAARGLERYQTEVNAEESYDLQVAAGKRLFRNRQGNRVFTVVRERLAAMCAGARRCCYCEDSAGDEIEHIMPKDLYPDRVFVWMNYLLSCAPCNRRKRNQFSVIRGDGLLDVTRGRGQPIRKPPRGDPALIDPRREDPLAFLELEITDTFLFLDRDGISTIDRDRANYTIDVLKLNREVLLAARREAYGSYRARLREYRDLRQDSVHRAALERLSRAIAASAHPTVWREMQRRHSIVEELRELFAEVPEALGW